MSFNANDYVNEYCTAEEVLEIKRAFDLFDRDLGGAIDPRGNFPSNLRTQSRHQLPRYWGQSPSRLSNDRWTRQGRKWFDRIRRIFQDDDHQTLNQRVQIINPQSLRHFWPTKDRYSFWLMQDTLLWRIWEKSLRTWENLLMTMSSKKWSREPILTTMESFPKKSSTTFWPKRFTEHQPQRKWFISLYF